MPYTTVADVEKVFNELFEAEMVERVDERNATDSHGQSFKMFYIHFLPGTTVEMEYFKTKMENDGMVQVMTGRGKWFWKVYWNKSTKTEKPVRKGPRIMTEEDEQLFLQWKEARNQTTSAFTADELDVLDEAVDKKETDFTEAELDELEAAQEEEEDPMAVADRMANE
jgi:hypothetical protein